MMRAIIISVLLALAAGCVATPAQRVAASAIGRAISEELDCMSECLESADENCETCARQCLGPASEPSASIASID